MPQSAICARINRMSDTEDKSWGHKDCPGDLRYLDIESGDYVEGKCGCDCHVEKRQWYLSDFGPPPHQILWINENMDLD